MTDESDLEILVERDMLRREINAIEDAFWPEDDSCPLSTAGDIEHYINCHADVLPLVARTLAKTLLKIRDAGRERHDKEDPG
jgi:hypothetical protein